MFPQIDKHFRCIDIYSSKAIVGLWVHPFKPIFHQNAKYLALGGGVGQYPRRQTFALGIPTCWYILALPPMPIPNANAEICLTPDANPRRQSVEYRWRWVFRRWGWCWACTFHVVYVNFICVGHPTQTRFFGGIWA